MTRSTILVVDDDADMRELVRHHLRGDGYDVTLAVSAVDARDAISVHRPDLIIADIDMPGTSGVELAAALRADAATAKIPLVYLTALEPDSGLARRTLGYPLLNKPLVASELLALVKQQLRR